MIYPVLTIPFIAKHVLVLSYLKKKFINVIFNNESNKITITIMLQK